MVVRPERVHDTHAPIDLLNLGSLVGCSRCWRLLSLRGGAVVTLAGQLACNEDHDLAALIRDCQERAIEVGQSAADRAALELRAALHGSSSAGGRHAARR